MIGTDRSARYYRLAIPWILLAAITIIAYQPTNPPAVADSDAGFSATRALEHVRSIATEPHPMGSIAIVNTRNYIVDVLEGIGVDVQLQSVTALDYYGEAELVEVVNVVGYLPGTASSGSIGLIAHYDTVPATPGANDNATAVASLLETARVLSSTTALRNDVVLIFTDGEEPAPRPGASAFVAENPRFDDLELVVNLEASGSSGASLLVEVNGSEGWLINEFGRIDSNPAAFSAVTATTRLLGDIGTDFDEFRNAGVAGMHFAYIRGGPVYHTQSDNIASVDPRSLQHHGDHALGVAEHFGMIELAPANGHEPAIYFQAGPLFITYRTALAVLFAFAAAVGAIVAVVRMPRHRSRGWSLQALAGRSAGFVGSILGATIVWILIAAMRPTLGIGEGYVYFGLLVTVAVVVTAKSTGPPGVTALAPWALLTVVTAFVGVGFSYLFVWPTIAAALALSAKSARAGSAVVRFGIVGVVTLVVMVPVIDTLLQLAYPRPGNPDSNVPVAVVVPLLLALLVANLLRAVWPSAAPVRRPV